MPDPRDKGEVVSGHPELFPFSERLPVTGLQEDPVKLLNEKWYQPRKIFLVPYFSFKPRASDGKESG